MITHEYLLSRIHYDPETGSFTWLAGHYKGKKAGGQCGTAPYKYISIMIDGKAILGHRLAYFYMTGNMPENLIDHKDDNGLNNKWDNLRPATRTQNNHNRIKCKHGKVSFKGVHICKESGLFRAVINVKGRKKHLGRFATAEQAGKAYQDAALVIQNEFNHAASNGLDFTVKEPAKKVE